MLKEDLILFLENNKSIINHGKPFTVKDFLTDKCIEKSNELNRIIENKKELLITIKEGNVLFLQRDNFFVMSIENALVALAGCKYVSEEDKPIFNDIIITRNIPSEEDILDYYSILASNNNADIDVIYHGDEIDLDKFLLYANYPNNLNNTETENTLLYLNLNDRDYQCVFVGNDNGLPVVKVRWYAYNRDSNVLLPTKVFSYAIHKEVIPVINNLIKEPYRVKTSLEDFINTNCNQGFLGMNKITKETEAIDQILKGETNI